MVLLRKPSKSAKKSEEKVEPQGVILHIDVMSVCYAVYFGIKTPLSIGEKRTEILYGFLNTILLLNKKFKTRMFSFCFDSKFLYKKEKYPWYKKRDTKMLDKKAEEKNKEKEALFEQVKEIKENILPTMGFTNIQYQHGVESDDLLASSVLNNKGSHVMVTSDEDMYQMLDYCAIYNHRKKVIFNKKMFIETYGIRPSQWVDVKRLAGCTSDKVPGIPGIGEITAIAYIKNELKPGKKLDGIEKDVHKEVESIFHRNDWLVRLPMPETKKVKLSFADETLSLDGFRIVCQDNSFRFLDRLARDEWVQFLG